MYTEVLRAIDGVAIFPIVSLLMFVVVFGLVLIWTARLDQPRLDRFARLPLEGDGTSDTARRLNGREKESDRDIQA